jgi:anti-sigma factor RsiW
MKNFRDIEQLSSYLDGQLSPSESARLESRLKSDPELASAFNDIRVARGILRKLPARKAPRNFTLTRQMVGLKPPLPRSYSVFRFSSAFAAFLLMLTFAANALIPRVSFRAAAPVAQASNFCAGCGGGAATEAPAAAAAPVVKAPSSEMAVPPTDALPLTSADSAREIATLTPNAKEPQTLSASQNQPQVHNEALIPIIWQIVLLIVGLVSAVIAFVISQNAKKKWS